MRTRGVTLSSFCFVSPDLRQQVAVLCEQPHLVFKQLERCRRRAAALQPVAIAEVGNARTRATASTSNSARTRAEPLVRSSTSTRDTDREERRVRRRAVRGLVEVCDDDNDDDEYACRLISCRVALCDVWSNSHSSTTMAITPRRTRRPYR
jgi:hypothetical protein